MVPYFFTPLKQLGDRYVTGLTDIPTPTMCDQPTTPNVVKMLVVD